jgi:TRAP-type C4-dicarboxylate transport system permease small subunit
MIIVKFIEFLRQRLKAVVRLTVAALVLLIVVDGLPFVVDKHHAHTAVEKIPGFWSVFGLVGCVIIILASKWFGHLGIMTREDYYDE